MITSTRGVVLRASTILLALGFTGCLATHKYVQNQAVQPLGKQIKDEDTKIDSKTGELDTRVTDLDRKTETGISEAQEHADAADKTAQGAQQQASAAQQTANKGVDLANTAQNQIENIDNYEQVKTATILFGFDKANLTADDQQELDSLAQSFSSLKHYAIEIEGFTDKTGSQEYNLGLSRRRADAVARYLTESANVPLVKIHLLGLGEDQPAEANNTRQGRKENRRVEVRVMAPHFAAAQAQAPQQQSSASIPETQ